MNDELNKAFCKTYLEFARCIVVKRCVTCLSLISFPLQTLFCIQDDKCASIILLKDFVEQFYLSMLEYVHQLKLKFNIIKQDFNKYQLFLRKFIKPINGNYFI